MQVCTSLQADNYASTPPLSFLQARCPSCRPTNSVKALKAIQPAINAQKWHKPSKQRRSSSVEWRLEATGKTATGKLLYCAAPNAANDSERSVLSSNSNIITHTTQLNKHWPLLKWQEDDLPTADSILGSLTQQSVTNTPTALGALSWRFDLCGAANTQQQNFCSRGTSPVELSSSPAA